MRKIKILHLISTLDIGGVQKQIFEVVSRLEGEEFSNTVGSFRDGILRESFENAGIPVVIFPRWFRFDPLLPFRIAGYLVKEKIEILQTYLFTANTWGRLGGILAGSTVMIASERNAIPWKGSIHLFLDHILSYPTASIVTSSQAVKKLVVKRALIPSHKIRVIYNGVDIQKFSSGDKKSARSRLSLPPQALIIGTVGRLHWCKGHRYLLEAFKKLLPEFPSLYLLIVGEGEERKKLEVLAYKLGVRHRVIFTGEIKEPVDYIRCMDIGVYPSLYEALGISILETLACEVPVVASKTGGIPEIVDEKCGFLVSPGDSESLAKAINILLKDEMKRRKMGKMGREKVKENFSIEKTVEEWKSLYGEVIKKKMRM